MYIVLLLGLILLYYITISNKKDKIIFYLLQKCNTTLKQAEYDIDPKGGGFYL
jgi:hypothetical protein